MNRKIRSKSSKKIKKDLKYYIEHADIVNIQEYSSNMNIVNIAYELEELPTKDILYALSIFHITIAANCLSYLDEKIRNKIISKINKKLLGKILSNMYIDDLWDTIQCYENSEGTEGISKVWDCINLKTKEELKEYKKILTKENHLKINPNILTLDQKMLVGDAISKIRDTHNQYEDNINYYVIDEHEKLVGQVSLKDIFFSDKNEKVEDIMTEAPSLYFRDTEDNIANQYRKYDCAEMPVINKQGKLLGVATSDDIIDLIEDITTADFEKSAGIQTSMYDNNYLDIRPWNLAIKRIKWLMFLMISASVSQIALTAFVNLITTDFQHLFSQGAASGGAGQSAIAVITLLVAALPVIDGTAGNSGSQSSTVIVRALSLNQITIKDWKKIIWKEFKVAMIIGSFLSVVNIGRMIIVYLIMYGTYHNVTVKQDIEVILTTTIGLFLSVIIAKTLGSALPLVAYVFKIDPAVMAAPLLTTLIDSLTTTIFFSAAIFVFWIGQYW